MSTVDDRLRDRLRSEVDEALAPGEETVLGRIVRRGRRQRLFGRVAIVACVALAVAGGSVALERVAHEGHIAPIAPVPSQTLRASSANIDGTAQVSSTRVRTGQVFTVTTTIDKFNGLSGFARIDPGDGTPSASGHSSGSCAAGVHDRSAPKSRNAQPSGGLDKLTYAYRLPGTYRITVSFLAYWPCTTYEETAGPLTFTVVVLPGAQVSAGPFPPFVNQGGINEDRAGLLHLDASFLDRTGWIGRIVVSWGDGTTRLFDFPLSGCSDPGTRWPTSERYITATHAYGHPGPHEVTFRIVRSGCDGRSRTTTTIAHAFRTPLRFREYLNDIGRTLDQ